MSCSRQTPRFGPRQASTNTARPAPAGVDACAGLHRLGRQTAMLSDPVWFVTFTTVPPVDGTV